jgi:hypothetical protein
MDKPLKSQFKVEVALSLFVELPWCEEFGDASASQHIEEAIAAAISQKREVFIFGEEQEPATVFVDNIDVIDIEGESDVYEPDDEPGEYIEGSNAGWKAAMGEGNDA